MMDLSEYQELLSELSPADLVAVSKMQELEKVRTLYDFGHRDFGENRVQNLLQRVEELPSDICWHLLGPLQSNKVKYVVPFVGLIHSVDRWKIVREIEKHAREINRSVDILFQIKISPEDSKSGWSMDKLRDHLASDEWSAMQYINARGVMGMASFSSDEALVSSEFERLHSYFGELKETFFAEDENFTEISMGMSSDYPLALERGSTIVRIGSKIFGARRY